jgi:tripartite-type tricarboxylate transporter receptor subunit TctC
MSHCQARSRQVHRRADSIEVREARFFGIVNRQRSVGVTLSYKRRALGALGLFCLSVAATSSSLAAYPERPIRLLVGYPTGGGADFTARLIGAELSKALGKQVVVDNRPGAEGSMAANTVARAAPDGYTLLLIPFNLALSPSLNKHLPYDPLKDFDAVTLIASAPMALAVNPSLPVKTVPDLVNLAKTRPGGLSYGSSGTGGTSHVAAELFKSMAKVNLVHVPYRGAGPVLLATITGEVNLCFGSLPPILTHMNAGTLRVVAVTTGKRAKVAPDIPTIGESGLPGYEFATWYGLGAPANTPRPIRLMLQGEIAKILAMNQIQTRLLGDGAEPIGSSPDDFQRYLVAEINKWKTVVKNAGITPE